MHVLKQTIASILFVAIMAPGAFFAIDMGAPKQAEAASASCLVGKIYAAILKVTSSVKGALGVPSDPSDTGSTADAAGSTISQELKECILDPLMIMIAKSLIRQLTTSIVDWINSGFEGSPSFIQDPAGFFTDIADETLGEFINGTDLGFLCEPFRLDIRIALAQSYRPYRQRATCTLSQIADNVSGFIEGNNSGGSWDQWLAMTIEPQNNPYGAFLQAQNEVEVRILGRKSINLAKLEWGNGFLSWEKCTDSEETYHAKREAEQYADAEAGSAEAVYAQEIVSKSVNKAQDCKIMTPGKVIQGQLDNTLSGPLRELELADEFDEIVGALVNQLTKQIFSAAGGLLGVSKRTPSSGGSAYLYDSYYTTPNEAVSSGSADSSFDAIYGSSTSQYAGSFGTGASTSTSPAYNVAVGKIADQSSTSGGFGPNYAVDGSLQSIVTNSNFPNIAITREESKPWWQVDLGGNYKIEQVIITPRGESCGLCSPLTNFHVFTSQSSFGTSFDPVVGAPGVTKSALQIKPAPYTDQTIVNLENRVGRFVRIQALDARSLQIAEVRVFAVPATAAEAESDLANVDLTAPTPASGNISFTPAFTQGLKLTGKAGNASLYSSSLSARSAQVKNNLTAKLTLLKVTGSQSTPVSFSTAFSKLQVSKKERGNYTSPTLVALSPSTYTIGTGIWITPEYDLELSYVGEGPAAFTTNFRGQQIPMPVQTGNYRLLTELFDQDGTLVGTQNTDFVLQ
jgi:hypothetical protein